MLFQFRMTLLSYSLRDKFGSIWTFCTESSASIFPCFIGTSHPPLLSIQLLKAIILSPNATHSAQVLLKHNRQLENQVKAAIIRRGSPFTEGLRRADGEWGGSVMVECSCVCCPHTIPSLWHTDKTARFKSPFTAIFAPSWWPASPRISHVTYIVKGPVRFDGGAPTSAEAHERRAAWQTIEVGGTELSLSLNTKQLSPQ